MKQTTSKPKNQNHSSINRTDDLQRFNPYEYLLDRDFVARAFWAYLERNDHVGAADLLMGYLDIRRTSGYGDRAGGKPEIYYALIANIPSVPEKKLARALAKKKDGRTTN